MRAGAARAPDRKPTEPQPRHGPNAPVDMSSDKCQSPGAARARGVPGSALPRNGPSAGPGALGSQIPGDPDHRVRIHQKGGREREPLDLASASGQTFRSLTLAATFAFSATA